METETESHPNDKLQAHYRDYGKMTYARCVFVIHNMAHQGRGPFAEVHNLELNEGYKEMYRWAPWRAVPEGGSLACGRVAESKSGGAWWAWMEMQQAFERPVASCELECGRSRSAPWLMHPPLLNTLQAG